MEVIGSLPRKRNMATHTNIYLKFQGVFKPPSKSSGLFFYFPVIPAQKPLAALHCHLNMPMFFSLTLRAYHDLTAAHLSQINDLIHGKNST